MDAIVLWDEEPGGNVEHVGEHGLTPEEVEEVLLDSRIASTFSRRTNSPCKFGYTSTGKHIIVVWEETRNPRVIYPVTAYEVPEPSGS